jgi:hypothetical protein
MLAFRTILNKYVIRKKNKDLVNDLTRSSIDKRIYANVAANTRYIVDEFHEMRPDLIAITIYGDQNMADLLLKYNAISNPFSLRKGDVLFIPAREDLIGMVKFPDPILDIGISGANKREDLFLNPKNNKDKDRIEQLKESSNVGEILPPNVNKKGDKNVKIKDGKLIFGEDVTSVNKENCPETLSRANLKRALIKNNLFG